MWPESDKKVFRDFFANPAPALLEQVGGAAVAGLGRDLLGGVDSLTLTQTHTKAFVELLL